MNRIKIVSAVIAFIFAFILFGCESKRNDTTREMPETEMETDTEMGGNIAAAILSPTEGNNVNGKVTFTMVDGGIKVVADIEGLKPGEHGFHIHENGDCSAPDASSAGDHFAPMGKKHGAPEDMERHVGDMGNIKADDDGKVHFEWTNKLMTFDGETSIIGKAVIVHEKPDDLKSQPSGDAGARLACGVIEMDGEDLQGDTVVVR